MQSLGAGVGRTTIFSHHLTCPQVQACSICTHAEGTNPDCSRNSPLNLSLHPGTTAAQEKLFGGSAPLVNLGPDPLQATLTDSQVKLCDVLGRGVDRVPLLLMCFSLSLFSHYLFNFHGKLSLKLVSTMPRACPESNRVLGVCLAEAGPCARDLPD